MGQGTDWLFWLVAIVLIMLFMYVPQWMARRQRKRREQELGPGDRVLTIGGFMGTLTYYNPQENVARIRLADGIVVDILPDAIHGKRVEESQDAAPLAEDEGG